MSESVRRFIVSLVTDVKINPARTGKTSSHPPGTDYYMNRDAHVAAQGRRFYRFVLLSWLVGYPLMAVAGVLIGRLT